MTDFAFPSSVVAGDTLALSISLDDYPASAGWSLSVLLLSPTESKITIGSSADGDSHAINVAASTTANYAPAKYTYHAFASKDTERHSVGKGAVEVLPDLATTDNYDGRSTNQKILDALILLEQGASANDVAAYSVEGTSITKLSPEERRQQIKVYEWKVARENNPGKLTRPINSRFRS